MSYTHDDLTYVYKLYTALSLPLPESNQLSKGIAQNWSMMKKKKRKEKKSSQSYTSRL